MERITDIHQESDIRDRSTGTGQQILENKKVKVNLADIELDGEDWAVFQALIRLTPQAKQQFLSDALQGMLEELLYDNPELFSQYAAKRS